MSEDKSQSAVPAIERALNILEYLGTVDKPVTLKEISSILKIPNASTFRIVKYLCSRGYLQEKSEPQAQYSLGLKILDLSHMLTKQLDITQIAKPSMKKLSELTGQTSQLAVLQKHGIMYIDQIFPTKPVSIIAPLRTELPVNISASGKVLVAHLSSDERDDYLKSMELVHKTSNSITDIDQLKVELKKVRKDGYAIDNEEFATGIGCLAAPIFDYSNRCIAAIGITGHICDYNDENSFNLMTKAIKDTADEISAQLGYTR